MTDATCATCELPETLAVVEAIKGGAPLSILVGEGFSAVQMVLSAQAQRWLRESLVKLLTPPPAPAKAQQQRIYA